MRLARVPAGTVVVLSAALCLTACYPNKPPKQVAVAEQPAAASAPAEAPAVTLPEVPVEPSVEPSAEASVEPSPTGATTGTTTTPDGTGTTSPATGSTTSATTTPTTPTPTKTSTTSTSTAKITTPARTTAAVPVSGAACAPAPTSALVVDVRTKGATPGDSSDDTAALQAAVEAVAGSGGTVTVPAGVYWVDATRGVRLKSRMTLKMADGAVLRAKATSSGNYNVVRVDSASNVNVVGGTLEGDLGRHQGSAGQWGHGLSINASTNVVVDGVTAKEAWGDGFYVGNAGTRNITLCRVTADHNRRQGISVTNVTTMTIRDSVFTRTVSEPGGAGSGIDLEPNGNEHVKDVRVIGNRITKNTIQGISIGMSDEFLSSSTISDITVSGNTLDDNGLDATPTRMRFGLLVSNASGVVVENNTITRSHGAGISVQYAKGTIVRGNRVSGTLKAGQYAEAGAAIHLEKDTGTVCTGNTLTGNAGPAISTYQSSSKVSGNTTS